MSPKVFVHGNPETDAVWSLLVETLRPRMSDQLLLLSPPGFGVPSPEGWEGRQSDYVDWLIDELVAIGESVDIVGHDWGAGHVYGLLDKRPDLVKSWVADCAGLLHPDYEWHDAAKTWQSSETGEAAVAMLIGMSIDEKATILESLGMTGDIAKQVAQHVNADMGARILSLYRSAAQPAMKELGARLALKNLPRGCVVVPTADHYPGTPAMAGAMAASLGATTLELEDRGHWWMIEAAEDAAQGLIDFWASAE